MRNHIPDVLYYPALLVWSLVYGSLAGAFFRLVSVYENWLAMNRLQVLLWKKYPHRSYRKYINYLWVSQVRGKPVELAEYTRQRIEKDHPVEPFPLARLFLNTVFMLLLAPFMAARGLVDGPVYVYRRGVAQRQAGQPLAQ